MTGISRHELWLWPFIFTHCLCLTFNSFSVCLHMFRFWTSIHSIMGPASNWSGQWHSARLQFSHCQPTTAYSTAVKHLSELQRRVASTWKLWMAINNSAEHSFRCHPSNRTDKWCLWSSCSCVFQRWQRDVALLCATEVPSASKRCEHETPHALNASMTFFKCSQCNVLIRKKQDTNAYALQGYSRIPLKAALLVTFKLNRGVGAFCCSETKLLVWFIEMLFFCCLIAGSLLITLPATLRNQVATFGVRVFKLNVTTGALEPVYEKLGLRQSDFPYVVTGLQPGLYLVRVDQQSPDGQISTIQQQNSAVDGKSMEAGFHVMKKKKRFLTDDQQLLLVRF